MIYLYDEFSFTINDIEIDSYLWDGQFCRSWWRESQWKTHVVKYLQTAKI